MAAETRIIPLYGSEDHPERDRVDELQTLIDQDPGHFGQIVFGMAEQLVEPDIKGKQKFIDKFIEQDAADTLEVAHVVDVVASVIEHGDDLVGMTFDKATQQALAEQQTTDRQALTQDDTVNATAARILTIARFSWRRKAWLEQNNTEAA